MIAFKRIRIGIGSPPFIEKTKTRNTIAHVLGNVSQKENIILDKVFRKLIELLEQLNFKNEDFIISELNSFKEAEN